MTRIRERFYIVIINSETTETENEKKLDEIQNYSCHTMYII